MTRSDRFARDLDEEWPDDPSEEQIAEKLRGLPEGFEHMRFRIKPDVASQLLLEMTDEESEDDDGEDAL